MDGWKGALLKMREALEGMKLVLVVVRTVGVLRARSAERSANDLARETGRSNSLRGVKRDVGDRLMSRDSRESIDGQSADRDRRFVHMRKDVVELPAFAHVIQRRVLKEVLDARIERTEPGADGQGTKGVNAIPPGEERFLRRRVRALRCYRASYCDAHDQPASPSSFHVVRPVRVAQYPLHPPCRDRRTVAWRYS